MLDIIVSAICDAICDAGRWVEVEEFGNAMRARLTTVFKLPTGISSHDTFGRVFAHIHPER